MRMRLVKMDHLSISASIVALAGTARSIAVACKLLYDVIFNILKELEALVLELKTFAEFLLKEVASENLGWW